MGILPERFGEENWLGVDACSLYGEYLGRNLETRHSMRDKTEIESAHHARIDRKNDGNQ